MEEKKYDVVVIGTGDAGQTVAYAAAKKKKKVAIIDKRPFGGTCALRGCISKKVLVTGAESADLVRRMNDIGIRLGSGRVSWKEIQQWKHEFTNQVPEENENAFEKEGIDAYHGRARFTDEQTIQVGETILQAKYIHIAAGAKPTPLNVQGAEYLATSDEFLSLSDLPKRIIFIGGGFISFEFAHIAARCGSEVMILQRSARVLKEFDQDLVELLIKASEEVGIMVKRNHPLVKIEKHGKSYVVFTQERGRQIRENADLIVHGAGRVPDIDDLNLETGNVAYSKQGVTVNKYLQSTSNRRVYAAGDAVDTGPMLTPTGMQEGNVAAYNMLHKTNRRYPDYTYIPSCVFSIPHLAKAGYTEEEAKEKGLSFDVHFKKTGDWFHNKRVNEPFAGHKVLVQKKTGRIIGAHVLGQNAGEVVNLLSFAMQHKMTADDIKKPLYVFPSALSSVPYMME